jgi:Xaa-Pro aminopeptidase
MTTLDALRAQLFAHQLGAYIQPVHDEWLSEYPPACNQRVEWLSGFAGSAGTLIVTKEKATMLVDGRYTLQAANQLDSVLYEVHNSADISIGQWLVSALPASARVGYDAYLFTQNMRDRIQPLLEAKSIQLVACPNLVDAIWKDRPPAPSAPAFAHALEYAGKATADKLQQVQAALRTRGVDAAILCAPDSVDWLLNIRGRDTQNTPLFLARAIVPTEGRVQLLADASRFDETLKAQLAPYVSFHAPEELGQVAAQFKDKLIQYDSAITPLAVLDICEAAGVALRAGEDPCLLPKAMKNPVELAGIRRAHIRDGVAIVKLLHWLDAECANAIITVDELQVGEKLLALRQQGELFVEPSFDTIAGSGPNGAIVHYRATETTNRTLRAGELFLLDSGGQYHDGTTDITRTIAIGTPAAEYKDRFTRVLKGHIAIATARFPAGTHGSQLDVLARHALWAEGLDYDHGTGHGVGCFLGVHEGPQRISKRAGDAPLKEGMIVSNEPGYYKNGAYGIRIENLVAVTPAVTGFHGFESLTCAPIDTRLVDVSLLIDTERAWLNSYHAWVLAQLQNKLTPSEREWLSARCAAI